MNENLQAERAQEWREALRKSMKNKDRTAIPRVKMPEMDPEVRSHTYDEVNLGLTEALALEESHRCLDCVDPTCISGCPVEINIPKFIKNIERGNYLEAARTLKEANAFPAVCGRVCPQERQCESQCFYTLKLNKEPVAIGYLERFAADYERMSGNISVPQTAPPNGIKIAVAGSGPAGLAFAGDMVKFGYDVTVFEALHELGGVLSLRHSRISSSQRYRGYRDRRPPKNGRQVRDQLHYRHDPHSGGSHGRRVPWYFYRQWCRSAQLYEYPWRESDRYHVEQ